MWAQTIQLNNFFCIIKILSFDSTVMIISNQILSNRFPFEIQPEGSVHDSLWIHSCILGMYHTNVQLPHSYQVQT